MNLKKIALSTAAAVMFGSISLAQGPAPEPKEGDHPEAPRPEMRENQPENKGPAKVHRECGSKEARPDRDARPMPPREGKGEFKPGDRPFPPMPRDGEGKGEFKPGDRPFPPMPRDGEGKGEFKHGDHPMPPHMRPDFKKGDKPMPPRDGKKVKPGKKVKGKDKAPKAEPPKDKE